MNSFFFLSHHYARLYSITPIGSLTRYLSPTLGLSISFNTQWHSRVFIAAGECAGRCNFNSIVSCIRGMIYAMHSRSCVTCTSLDGMKRTDVAPRLYLGFVGDAFVTLTGSFLFPSFLFFFFSSTPFSRVRRIGQDDLLTGNRKANSISESLDLYSLSDSYSSKNRSHICFYIFLFSCWNI